MAAWKTVQARGNLSHRGPKCAGLRWIGANYVLRLRVAAFPVAVPRSEPGTAGRATALRRSLFRVRLFLARPGARDALERLPRAAIHGRARRSEDRAFERRRGEHLAPRGVAVLGLRGLALVDHAPGLLEDLLAQEAGDKAAGDAERDEQELHRLRTVSRCSPPFVRVTSISSWSPRSSIFAIASCASRSAG